MKLAIHELAAARDAIADDRLEEAQKLLARVSPHLRAAQQRLGRPPHHDARPTTPSSATPSASPRASSPPSTA